MDLSEQIIAALRARNNSGESYEQMGKSFGISHAHIHRLVNGKADPLKMSLETFLSLFPAAQIELAPARAQDDPAASRDLDLLRRELDAERRELDAIRRELDAERRLLELEREVRPPAPPGVLITHDPHAPYHISAKSSSLSNK